MKSSKPKFESVDDYIDSFQETVREKLKAIRKIIRKGAPKAEELVAYDMAGYKLNGPLIYFAAFKKHIGIYPGSIKIPLDEPIPTKMISELVKRQVVKNTSLPLKKSKTKSKKK